MSENDTSENNTPSERDTSDASVYRLAASDVGHRLYLGEFSTWQGLALFDPDLSFRAMQMTDNKLPIEQALARLAEFESVGQATAFFAIDGNHLDMIDFECLIDGCVRLSTHDDGECHFQFADLDAVKHALKKAVPVEQFDALWQLLNRNLESYVVVAPCGTTTTYPTFDDYILGNS